MDLSQQELPITAYFARSNKDSKEAQLTKKRKLALAADARGGPAKREKRAVISPNVRTSVQDNDAKRAKQAKLPVLKPPIALASSRRKSLLLSDDVVLPDSSPKRPVAGSSRAPKANSNIVSHRISIPGSSRDKGLTHVTSTAVQSLATPPPTNQSKKRPVTITAALKPVPQRTTFTAVTPGIAALPTPETTVHKLGNINAPSGLRTFIGATSPCRVQHVSGIHVPSSPPLASAQLTMKFAASIDDDLDSHSIRRSGFFNGAQQAVDPDDPFTCAVRDKEVHMATPASSPVLPSRDLQSVPACSNIIEELVPSSQSQYLLPIDATPSHKRTSKRPVRTNNLEPVQSSQSQEKEMGMSPMSGNVLNKLSLARGEVDLPTPRPMRHIARHDRSFLKPLHQFAHGSSSVTSPVASSSKGFSHSFLATKFPRNRAAFVASPCRSPLKRTPRRVLGNISPIKKSVGRTEPVENIRPEQEDDSVTEPESEPEVFKPGQDDGSETEPESDVVPVRAPAEIGKCKPQDIDQWPQATSPRASSLHSSTSTKRSPYRRRRTPPLSYTSSLDDLMREGAGMSVPARRCFMLPSSGTQTAARDFLDMFQGDGSYPDDFPESLRC